MEFIGKLKRTVTLSNETISIEARGWVEKTNIEKKPNVSFSIDKILGIELNEKTWTSEGFLQFIVEGQDNKPKIDSSYSVMFVASQLDEVKNFRNIILEKIEKKKSAIADNEKAVQAKQKLKEAKENLDLEIISQEEYENLKSKLSPIILGTTASENTKSNKLPNYEKELKTDTKKEVMEKTKIEQEQSKENIHSENINSSEYKKELASSNNKKAIAIGIGAIIFFFIMFADKTLDCGMCGDKISSEVGRSFQHVDWHGKIKRDGKAETYNFCDRKCQAKFAADYMISMKKYIEP